VRVVYIPCRVEAGSIQCDDTILIFLYLKHRFSMLDLCPANDRQFVLKSSVHF
jgi:hypothetical protein